MIEMVSSRLARYLCVCLTGVLLFLAAYIHWVVGTCGFIVQV